MKQLGWNSESALSLGTQKNIKLNSKNIKLNCIISTDEDPSLRIESSAIINLRGVSTKLNKHKIKLFQHR